MNVQECMTHIRARMDSIIQSLFDAAETWPREHWLAVGEQKVREATAQVGQTVLQSLVDRHGTGHTGQYCQGKNGETLKFKEYCPRRVITLVGHITIQRASYRVECGEGAALYPLDEELALKGEYSEGVEEIVAFTGSQLTYTETSRLLEKSIGINVSEWKVQEVGETWGEEALEERARRLPTEVLSKRMAVGVDAAKVRTALRRRKRKGSRKQHFEERWMDAKLAVAYGFDKRGEANSDKRYVASLQGRDAFAKRVWQMIESTGADKAEQVAWLGDGAEWVWSVKEEILPHAVEILDFFHANDHLWTVAKAVWGENSKPGKRWVRAEKGRLLASRVDHVIEHLKQLSRQVGVPPKGCDSSDRRQVVASNVKYFEHNASRMDYKRYREQGYPIGSGVVESGCKHVIAQRMKITAGMSWNARQAEAILQLRCLVRSGQWDSFWSYKRMVA